MQSLGEEATRQWARLLVYLSAIGYGSVSLGSFSGLQFSHLRSRMTPLCVGPIFYPVLYTDRACLLTWAQVAKPVLKLCLWGPLPVTFSQGIILPSCEVGAPQEAAGLCLAPHRAPYREVASSFFSFQCLTRETPVSFAYVPADSMSI